LRKQEKRLNNKVNREIESKMVRIVNIKEWIDSDDYDDYDDIQDVMTTDRAIDLAENLETDLIEIATSKDTSICKLMAVDKFIYQEKKKAKLAKASRPKAEQKEIKLSVDIAENDFNTKERHAREFLTKGNYVKVSLQLKGRRQGSQVIRDNATALVLKFVDNLSDVGKTSSMPTWQGNKVFVQINPK
jgi:translation initiation factor IF-3